MSTDIKHPKPRDPRQTPYTREEVLGLAKQYTRLIDFRKNHYGAYRAGVAKLGLRAELHTFLKSREYWTREVVLARALEFSSRQEWRKTCSVSYQKAHKLKIYRQCVAHMPKVSSPGCPRTWTKEKIIEASKECPTMRDFLKRYPGAHCAAYSLGIMREIYQPTRKPAGYWDNPKNIFASTDGYETIAAWREGNFCAYRAARKLGIYDEVVMALEAEQIPKS